MLEYVEHTVTRKVEARHERGPRAPGVRRDRGQAVAVSSAVDQRGEVGKLPGVEKGTQDLPIDPVPADYQHSFWHVAQVISRGYDGRGKTRGPNACLTIVRRELFGLATRLCHAIGAQSQLQPQLVFGIA